MSKFAPAVAITLKNEGGFMHNPKTGEVVNHGITLKTLRGLGVLKTTGPTIVADIEFVKSLTADEAADIYEQEYWDKFHLDRLDSQELANKVFDIQVNTGRGVRLLQKALKITADGIVGEHTIAAANAADPVALLADLRIETENYYRAIAAADPNKAPYLPGWLARLKTA